MRRAWTLLPFLLFMTTVCASASSLSVPKGFTIDIIAHVDGARELTFAPNGDLFAGTSGDSVAIVQNAEGASPHAATFVTLFDAPAAGVFLSLQYGSLYVGTQHGVYRIPYHLGDRVARSHPLKIASVRTGGGDYHNTTSVALTRGTLFASVGSSCNACAQSDPTRATIQVMHPDDGGMTPRAKNIRNAIALAVNPATGTLWAGDAGQDELPAGHPYEFFDAVTSHPGIANYGWPPCEENRHAYRLGANCSSVVVPLVVFPAYETVVGAAFYDAPPHARFLFPAQYHGGAFVTMHGSWHAGANGVPISPPRVVFVPMRGDAPKTAVNWRDPNAQWRDFVSGYQQSDGHRIGRPTGVAIGPQGDLFVADDLTGNIYRIRH